MKQIQNVLFFSFLVGFVIVVAIAAFGSGLIVAMFGLLFYIVQSIVELILAGVLRFILWLMPIEEE